MARWDGDGRETYREFGVYFSEGISSHPAGDVEFIVSLNSENTSSVTFVDFHSVSMGFC